METYSSVTTKQGYVSRLPVQGVTWVRRRCFRTKSDWAKLISLYFLKAARCHLGISLCSSFIGSSVQFTCSVISNSLRPHGLQHARPPCPSPTPRDYSNSCPLSQWCHPTITSSAIPYSSLPPSFPSLLKSVSSSHQVAKVLEFQLQHQSFQWIFRTNSFRMDCLDLLAVQGTLKSLLQHHSSKASILQHSAFFTVQLSHL